jgi:xylulokinase
MTLVAGVDSSTQSCKVVVCDAESGVVMRAGHAPHAAGTEIDPAHWLAAFEAAVERAGGLDDVAALSVGAQQHGMVCLDDSGRVVRPAILWNDVRSAPQAAALVEEFGGPDVGSRYWAAAVGSVPVASFTVTKLRWLAENEPSHAAKTAAVCLPHDWLTWRLGDRAELDALATDRSDASGTGYFSAATGEYRIDLFEHAFGRKAALPSLRHPAEAAGRTAKGQLLGCGTGDNAGAALGIGAVPGDVVISIGTSGVVAAVSELPTADATGTVAGFADATGRFLPLTATLNAARVLDATALLLGVDDDGLSALALKAPAGAGGLVLVPYFEGERTPNRPFATGAVHGLRLENSTPEHLARAAVEGVLCGVAAGFDAVLGQGVRAERVILVGGGSRSEAVRKVAPSIFSRPVLVPPQAEYVAIGAARQAAWTLAGGETPPAWSMGAAITYEAKSAEFVRARYAEAAELTLRSLDREARPR